MSRPRKVNRASSSLNLDCKTVKEICKYLKEEEKFLKKEYPSATNIKIDTCLEVPYSEGYRIGFSYDRDETKAERVERVSREKNIADRNTTIELAQLEKLKKKYGE